MKAHCSGAQVALKALVTGGTGFVGSRVLRMLLDDGWKVRALVLPAERQRLPKHSDLEQVVGDVTKYETLRGTMDDVGGVFYFAALVETLVRDPDLFPLVYV